jgi:integrase
MARTVNRLTAKAVENAKPDGRYADGSGLYLLTTNGGRRWVFIYSDDKRRKEMGLGSAQVVSLARARELAAEARELLSRGIDPRQERERRREAAKTPKEGPPTFGACAAALIKQMSPGWQNPKHRQQWANTLKQHAAALTDVPVADVTTKAVLDVLEPLWTRTPETASRLRGRIERVLDFARVKGFRSGENPARWRGHLDQILPARSSLGRGHHAALPYEAIGAFMRQLRSREGVSARALELLIMTAARSGEVLQARWDEFDIARGVWTVPAARMKARREHRVPLSSAALKVLEAVKPLSRGAYIFPTQAPRSTIDAPLSLMSLEMLLRRMNVAATPHGFRSTFRDWCAEETAFPNMVAEMALAHTINDRTEAAYRRGDLFEKRRAMMEAWAGYCAKPPKLKAVSGGAQ